MPNVHPAEEATLIARREAPRQSEQPFWRAHGAAWKQLAGGISEAGFSFEWHDWHAPVSIRWEGSFHPETVEICLNLEGAAWIQAAGQKIEFGPDSAGFVAITGSGVLAEREGGQRHRFLSVEFSRSFLRRHLHSARREVHPVIVRCIQKKTFAPAVVGPTAITHRHRDLLRSLLHPPVLIAAQRLWYESKAMEFIAEFFFAPNGAETLCTRAQRLAGERVAMTKRVLAASLGENLSLQELGKRVGCSPFYLSRTFTQETGLTISQWLRRARLEKAAELLKSGKYNVTEAALEVGYSSLSHFSQAFHEMFGCCPGLYPLRTPTQNSR